MLELYFMDRENKKLFRFGKTDYLEGLLDILQIVVDSCSGGLADVVILDPGRSGKMASAARVADCYGLRKRTFDEKIRNVKTYKLEA